MKQTMIGAVALTVTIFAAQTQALGQNPSEAERFSAVSRVVQLYLDGTSQGRPDLVGEAFLPSLELNGLYEDETLLTISGPDYIARIEEGVPIPREGRIVSIDATDRSAMVKVEIVSRGRLFTDYLLMLRVEGEWKIVNKIATWVPLEQ